MHTNKGDIYIGECEDDAVQGNGKFISGDGNVIYEGQLKDGFFHGQGKRTILQDGLVYVGEFDKGN